MHPLNQLQSIASEIMNFPAFNYLEYKKRADELTSEFKTARNQLELKSDSLASQLQQLTRQNEMISQVYMSLRIRLSQF